MTPIRTLVVESIITALSTITALLTVEKYKPRPIDLLMVRTPAAYVYDTLPETRTRNNRYVDAEMDVAIVVFIPLTAADESTGNVGFSETADIIQAEIHDALFSEIPLPNKAITDILESSVEREIQSEQFGELTYIVRVKYRHARGNAYSTVN